MPNSDVRLEQGRLALRPANKPEATGTRREAVQPDVADATGAIESLAAQFRHLLSRDFRSPRHKSGCATTAVMAITIGTLMSLPSLGNAQLELRPDVPIPELPAFKPLPPDDPRFTAEIARLVKEIGLDEHTSASVNPDKEEEWSSICIVDLTDIDHPRVGSWEADNFVYPASTYKMYVVGEAIRQVCAGERSLDDPTTVAANNVRSDSRLTTDQVVPLSEVLRLISQYSDNTAANVAIDTVDRQRASALLRAMGCQGSDITRKYLPRTREDEGYTTAPGTYTTARHLATFLWAVETGSVGGGHGRGLMKGYLATNEKNKERLRAGLPDSATIYSKTGWWDIFVSEAGIVEDGRVKYIFCVLTAQPLEVSGPKIARLGRSVHELLRRRTTGD